MYKYIPEGTIVSYPYAGDGQPKWLKKKCIYKKIVKGQKHQGEMAVHKINGKDSDYWFISESHLEIHEKYTQLKLEI